MRKRITLLILSILFLGFTRPARADSGTQVEDVDVTHIFGEKIQVNATLETDTPVRTLEIILQYEDGTEIATEAVVPESDGSLNYTLDLIEHPVRAFSTILIEFTIKLEDGNSITSPPSNVFYDDNRFEWQNLEKGEFSVYWYQDDPDLGEAIIEIALEGWERIHSLLEVPPPEDIKIYAYDNAIDMQETLIFSGNSSYWIAGHAASDLGVIIVSLPPGPEQTLEIKRQIPHELVHILLFRKMGPGYTHLPRWLNEGMASTAELFPNPDYQLLLENAYERQTLIPIRDLCTSFPTDAASFQLSYAEAYAFTNYLQQTDGKEKIDELILSYTRGSSCEAGISDTYQKTLNQLEGDWREVMFNENRLLNLWLQNLPLVLVFSAVLITPMSLMIIGARKRKTNPDE